MILAAFRMRDLNTHHHYLKTLPTLTLGCCMLSIEHTVVAMLSVPAALQEIEMLAAIPIAASIQENTLFFKNITKIIYKYNLRQRYAVHFT